MQFDSHGFDFNCFFFTKKYYFKQFITIEKFNWITNHHHACSFGAKEYEENRCVELTFECSDLIQFAPSFLTK